VSGSPPVNSAKAALGSTRSAVGASACPARRRGPRRTWPHSGFARSLGREQLVERLRHPCWTRSATSLLHLHHEVGNLGSAKVIGYMRDGLRKAFVFFPRWRSPAATYQQTDPIWCSCHGPPRLRAIVRLASVRVGRISYPWEPCRRTINMGNTGCLQLGSAAVSPVKTGACWLSRAGIAPGGVDRAVETVERALDKHGAPGVRGVTRSCTNRPWSSNTLRQGLAPCFVDENRERGARGARSWCSPPTAVAPTRAHQRCRAQASGHRRHPAPLVHQGCTTRPSGFRPRRLRHPADRSRGPRGGRRHRRWRPRTTCSSSTGPTPSTTWTRA